ncbi:hypothetical protein P171DRAFT_433833 [Karstenula rhodostoma CBS 690.94]|uniref:Secreted protein n=1 Tax=Karstenula rhodostoma CBS 690.94 TaxID=1392251 RepID=A0A9P4UAQ2_9PLEO|nr:hypothetical protein P171DRAFT_433833 [Karstenula rhodostoma CBS 690.94]
MVLLVLISVLSHFCRGSLQEFRPSVYEHASCPELAHDLRPPMHHKMSFRSYSAWLQFSTQHARLVLYSCRICLLGLLRDNTS